MNSHSKCTHCSILCTSILTENRILSPFARKGGLGSSCKLTEYWEEPGSEGSGRRVAGSLPSHENVHFDREWENSVYLLGSILILNQFARFKIFITGERKRASWRSIIFPPCSEKRQTESERWKILIKLRRPLRMWSPPKKWFLSVIFHVQSMKKLPRSRIKSLFRHVSVEQAPGFGWGLNTENIMVTLFVPHPLFCSCSQGNSLQV